MPAATNQTSPYDADRYQPVDIAIVVESTYPYLRGGLSAVVHDIIKAHPDKSIGIIHIAWDSSAPDKDLYGMPANVRWVFPVYLSINEHSADFRELSPSALGMSASSRRLLAARLFAALKAAADHQDYSPLWQLYDDGMNPNTRRYPLWTLLGSKEFLVEARRFLAHLDISLTDLFWLLRDFFSLACAVMGPSYPPAAIYHSHTTGYAALASAAAARQNSARFLLTEHNLYTRDSINTMLDVSMDRVVRADDWRVARGVTVQQRAWMAWYIEMGRLAYDAADKITYLYPQAIDEAIDLGAAPEKTFVLPNGVPVEIFDPAHQRFCQRRLENDRQPRPWRLAFAARLVPIKGLLPLLEALALLRRSGRVQFTLDVMGHSDEAPDYAAQCLQRCTELGLDDVITFAGSQDLRSVLGDYDLLVLPSYNEGQPIVVLEAMTIGLPVVGSRVGGMAQLVEDPLTRSGDGCGVLVEPGNPHSLARALDAVLSEPRFYNELQSNARTRVLSHFRLEQAMFAYRSTYHQLIAVGSRGEQPSVRRPLQTQAARL